MSARFLAFAAASLWLGVPAVAASEPMDPALGRLSLNSAACRNSVGVFNPAEICRPDHAAFAKLINQYGAAFAPTAMHSARTTGYGGFHLSLEAAYTSIDSDADYWKNGTQGPIDPSSNQASISNNSPQSILQLYSAKVRKSFGFGLELTGSVGFMPKTSLVGGGADIRLSLLEGFRKGVLGILPDVAVGGAVRTITGTAELQLTVAGLDAQVSKPIAIQDSSVITPWVGFQQLWIFGDSGLIDLTPGTDAVQACNFAGSNLPGSEDPNKTVHDGQPVCRGGSVQDFNNTVVFNNVRVQRQRLLAGVNYRYEMLMVGGQFITDLIAPSDVNDEPEMSDQGRQITIVLELGAIW